MSSMSDQSIRILAEPADAFTCAFTVDRPILPDRAVRFGTRDKAAGSPLAEALFAVPGVAAVSASGRKVLVRKSTEDEWGPLARQIGAAIRQTLQRGGPIFSQEAIQGTTQDGEARNRVLQIVDAEINPIVAGHGGHIGVVDVKDGAVFVQMSGGCMGCGMAHITLRQGVERLVRERMPEVTEVVDVTDHADGEHPYVAPPQ
jgi:Fe-S cluster biogenesis protein NfuA